MKKQDNSVHFGKLATRKIGRVVRNDLSRFASIRVHDATQQLYTTPVELDGRKGKFTIDAVFQVGEKMFEAISVGRSGSISNFSVFGPGNNSSKCAGVENDREGILYEKWMGKKQRSARISSNSKFGKVDLLRHNLV